MPAAEAMAAGGQGQGDGGVGGAAGGDGGVSEGGRVGMLTRDELLASSTQAAAAVVVKF